MAAIEKEKGRLERALKRKKFHNSVTVKRELFGVDDDPERLMFVFADGRQAFGAYKELRSRLEAATGVEQLQASCVSDDPPVD